MTNRSVRTLATAAALALVLTSCAQSQREGTGGSTGSKDGDTSTSSAGGGAAAGGEGGDGTFVFGAAGAPTTFDPFYASDGETFRISRQIFQNLIGIEAGGTEAIPELATEWTSSEDGLTWDFKLQEGVKFHDGTDFDAEAVCANFERWYTQNEIGQSDAVTSYWASDFGGFKDSEGESLYDSCEATDELTAQVKITRATGKFPMVLSQAAYAMQSPTAMEKYDANGVKQEGEAFVFPAYANEHPTGTGPFKFAGYDDGAGQVTLERNDDYWGEKAGVKELVFRIIPEENARRQELESGTINGYDLPNPVDWQALEDAGNQVLIRDPFNVLYLGLNPTSDEDLMDLKVRQALYHAINRDALVKNQLPEGAEVATQFIPSTVVGYNTDLDAYAYDPEKAKSLLKEAGKEGMEIDLWYPTEVSRPYMPDPLRIYEAVKADWEAIGVKVNPISKPWNGGYLDGVQGEKGAPAFFLGWTGDYNSPDNFLSSFFGTSTNSFGTANYDWGKELNEALKAADSEPDVDKRTQMYSDVNAKIMEEWLPGLPISHSPPAIVVGPNVEGLVQSPLTAEDFSTVTLSE